MEALPKISPDRLKAILHQHVKEFAEQLVDEVNAAAAGRLIADSEEGVRRLIQVFGQSVYESLLQQKVATAGATFSLPEETTIAPVTQQAVRKRLRNKAGKRGKC